MRCLQLGWGLNRTQPPAGQYTTTGLSGGTLLAEINDRKYMKGEVWRCSEGTSPPETVLPQLLVRPALQGEMLGGMAHCGRALACLAHAILHAHMGQPHTLCCILACLLACRGIMRQAEVSVC